MNDFIALVRDLRTVQRRWLKFRDTAALQETKRLEREVDRWLERQDGPRAEPTLFDRRPPLYVEPDSDYDLPSAPEGGRMKEEG